MSSTHRLTLKQACDLLGKKERTVRRYVQTGLLSKIYVDGENGWELRLSEAEVRALARRGPGAAGKAEAAEPEESADTVEGVSASVFSSPAPRASGGTAYACAAGVTAPFGDEPAAIEEAPGLILSPGDPASSAGGGDQVGDRKVRQSSPALQSFPSRRAIRRRDDPGDLRLELAFGVFFELVQREYEAGRDAYLLGLEELWQQQRAGDENAPGKGVWVLHMLRQALGDGRFWPALERFARQYGFDRGTPSEFLAVMEESAGEPLGSRFGPWFQYPDLPQVAVGWRWDPSGPGLTLTMAQTVDPERETPFYPITTTVLLESPQGSRTVWVTMRERAEEFHLHAPVRPRLVLIDPAHELAMVVQASKRAEEWLEQLRRGPDALHRLQAIEGLRGAWGAPEVEAALRRVVQDDPCGGVRAAAARALAPMPAPACPQRSELRSSASGALEPPPHGERHALPMAPWTSSSGVSKTFTLASEAATSAAEASEGTVLPVTAEVEQLKRELRRLRAEQAQIERRLLLLELRTRPRVSEERGSSLPAESGVSLPAAEPPGG